jgi:uncharacterized SAM-binding protein YcdF (DUF218 family)
MSMRQHHRRAILRDTDALHALAVALAVLVGSGGLAYVGYCLHVRRVARQAPVTAAPEDSAAVLVFGKHSPDGRPDAEFHARIERARELAHAHPRRPVLLLGGGEGPTEAEIAERSLRGGALPEECELVLEHHSRDTFENLRHARDLLRARGIERAVLVSNRHHLARCAAFARHLGIAHALCAAEPSASVESRKMAREAALLMWIDLGRRWARLIGHRRMLAKLA